MARTTRRVETFDGSPSVGLVLSLLAGRRAPILLNRLDIPLPDDVVDEIEDRASGSPDALILPVRANPGLDTGVRIYWVGSAVARARFIGAQLAAQLLSRTRSSLRALVRIAKGGARATSTSRSSGRVRPPVSGEDGGATLPVPGVGAGVAGGEELAPVGRATATGALFRRLSDPVNAFDQWLESRARRLAESGREVPAGPVLTSYVLTRTLDRLSGLSFPHHVHLALTKHCNLRCVMCPYHSEELRNQHETSYFADGGQMSRDVLERVLREIGAHGSTVGFGQYDEPFIYKRFVDVVEDAKRWGCVVSITTNGTLLDPASSERLVRAGVEHVSFSLDAASDESYRQIRLDDFSVPIANLRALVEARDRLRSPMQIRACMVVQDGNRHEQQRFLDLMESIGLDVVSFYTLSKLDRGVWVNERLNFEIQYAAAGTRHACSQLWNQVAIYPDANVALCCATTLYVGYRTDVPYVGNLNESSLERIWLSSQYHKIREEALRGVFENSVCRDCEIWHNFQTVTRTDDRGRRVIENPYERFVYFRTPA